MTDGPHHPKIEVDVGAGLVRALLAAQHPDLVALPLHGRVHGWDNMTWRLGDALAVRLPVRAAAADLVVHEQRWLPTIAPRLPVPVPAPVRVGRPGEGYPWPWSVVPWLPGRAVASGAVPARRTWAPLLAGALAALHVPAPADAPHNPFRGVPLAARDDPVRARLTPDLPHAGALVDAWEAGLRAPAHGGAPVWLHGDPHPGNLLDDGRTLTGLVDFGDVCGGDPASDLATAWMTFDAEGRAAFVARTQELRGWDDATWARARAWAAAFVPVLLAHPEEYPLMARVGRHTAEQLTAG